MLKIVEKNHILVLWIGSLANFAHESFPLTICLLEDFFENTVTFVLLHLNVQLAEIVKAETFMPA